MHSKQEVEWTLVEECAQPVGIVSL
jgi:hypothetical protein